MDSYLKFAGMEVRRLYAARTTSENLIETHYPVKEMIDGCLWTGEVDYVIASSGTRCFLIDINPSCFICFTHPHSTCSTHTLNHSYNSNFHKIIGNIQLKRKNRWIIITTSTNANYSGTCSSLCIHASVRGWRVHWLTGLHGDSTEWTEVKFWVVTLIHTYAQIHPTHTFTYTMIYRRLTCHTEKLVHSHCISSHNTPHYVFIKSNGSQNHKQGSASKCQLKKCVWIIPTLKKLTMRTCSYYPCW